MNEIYNLTGKKFNRLLVIQRVEGVNNERMWECLCDCGTVCVKQGSKIRSGYVKSCGCLHRENFNHKTHGKSHTKTYTIWSGIKQRCTDDGIPAYIWSRYGGRGITICDRWLESYENFLADMGEAPPGMEIDRIDNDRGYSPENCQWTTKKENCRNRSNARIITHNGVTRQLHDWADLLGIKYTTLHNRIYVLGWDAERAFNKTLWERK